MKGIQDEYQNFMEKVRGKAQTAIDMANRHFEADRTQLTSQVDILVQVMQSRFYFPVCSTPSCFPVVSPLCQSGNNNQLRFGWGKRSSHRHLAMPGQ